MLNNWPISSMAGARTSVYCHLCLLPVLFISDFSLCQLYKSGSYVPLSSKYALQFVLIFWPVSYGKICDQYSGRTWGFSISFCHFFSCHLGIRFSHVHNQDMLDSETVGFIYRLLKVHHSALEAESVTSYHSVLEQVVYKRVDSYYIQQTDNMSRTFVAQIT